MTSIVRGILRGSTARLRRRILAVIKPELFDWTGIDTVFIVSTGRTATRFLAKFFETACRSVNARHEPNPDLFDVATAFARGEVNLADSQRRIVAARAAICEEVRRTGASTYIEANNNLAYLIPAIREVFPRAKYIHITRDGRDFVRSSFSKTVRNDTSGSVDALFMTEDDHRRRLQAIDLPNDPYHDRWRHMSRFERICWYWMKKDGIIRDALCDVNDAIVVKFEDMFDSDRDHVGLWRMLEFIGLTDHMTLARDDLRNILNARENQTQRHLIAPSEDWTPEQRNWFAEIAGTHMQRCGYTL